MERDTTVGVALPVAKNTRYRELSSRMKEGWNEVPPKSQEP
jgi:hypothetical protein